LFVSLVFYSMAISHPCQTVRVMLDLKEVDYEIVNVPTGFQRVRLPLAGFRAGTVPAIKLDGRRVQGSRAIARALDERFPDPPLFPTDPERRVAVQEAERWGEEEFQPIPRRLFRFSLAHNPELRRWVLRNQGLPNLPPVAAAVQLISAGDARTGRPASCRRHVDRRPTERCDPPGPEHSLDAPCVCRSPRTGGVVRVRRACSGGVRARGGIDPARVRARMARTDRRGQGARRRGLARRFAQARTDPRATEGDPPLAVGRSCNQLCVT
jgi:hypothetical protein